MEDIQQCPEFPHFGAHYPDARCINGYLWDLDKYEDGHLYGGGDDPCPFCKTEEYIKWATDEEEDAMAISQVRNHVQWLRDKYQYKTI